MDDMEVLVLPLAAGTLSPPVSRGALCQAFLRAIQREFNPQGLTENLLARDAARRAAQLVLDEQLGDALQDQFAQTLSSADQSAQENDALSQLLVHAKIGAAERYAKLTGQSLRNASALFHELRQLQELQRNRSENHVSEAVRDRRFLTEAACLTYLVRRYRQGEQGCPRCGQAGRGCWIASRLSWECGGCKVQIGVRIGTVMERSKLPLRVWFAAIEFVLLDPEIAPGELGRRIGLNRPATIRHVATKIRAAMKADNASALLAGLDEVFLACT